MNNLFHFPENMSSQERNGFQIALAIAVAHFVAVPYYLYVVTERTTGTASYLTLIAITLALGVLVGIGAVLSRRGRPTLGIFLALGVLAVSYPPIATLVSGLGTVLGIALIFVGPMSAFQVLPRKLAWILTTLTILSGLATLLLDAFGSITRPSLPGIFIQLLAATVVIGLGVLIARQFRNYSLRTKFLTSILFTVGLSIAAFSVFAVYSTSQSQTFMLEQLQTAVRSQAKLLITGATRTAAFDAEETLSEMVEEVGKLAEYQATLYAQSTILEQGLYWDANTRLTKLSGGQYGNSQTDIASVFVPSTVVLNNAMIANINTSIYLDFIAPTILKSNSNIAAIYFIGTDGSTVYYPNIGLAEVVPPDFEPRQRPFYTIATPEKNPERKVMWTDPYQDAAGNGLLVTASAPIYDQAGKFRGVMAVDVRLIDISNNVAEIKAGDSGFAFLIDSSGRLIGMPEAGYKFFDLTPEIVPIDQTPTQTVLGQGSIEVQAVIRKMTAGETGLEVISIQDEQYYIAYEPLSRVGYSLGVVAPVRELDAPYFLARDQVNNRTQSANQLFLIILVVILLTAVGGSLLLSQFLSGPIVRLTSVAEQIAAGNLGAQAKIESTDETGKLAGAFNRMTSQLTETLQDLEQRVSARTRDLATVAEVGTATATILESKRLLQEVVDLTKERFHLYHSHIYLLDEKGENLVLVSGAGEPGRIMVAEGRSIPLSREQSLVARAARERKGVSVNDVTQAPDFLPNPLLPDTRSELAVPMIVGGNVIGVFDIQSEQVGRFSDSDVSIQTTLAAQLATSIQNVRSFEQSKKQADFEARVNLIGQKIQLATTIEETLQTAIRELGTAVGASRVRANIGTNRQHDRDEVSHN